MNARFPLIAVFYWWCMWSPNCVISVRYACKRWTIAGFSTANISW